MIYENLSVFDKVFEPQISFEELIDTVTEYLKSYSESSDSHDFPDKYIGLLTTNATSNTGINAREVADLIFERYDTNIKNIEKITCDIKSAEIFRHVLENEKYKITEQKKPEFIGSNCIFRYAGEKYFDDVKALVRFTCGQVTEGPKFSICIEQKRNMKLKEFLQGKSVNKLSAKFNAEFPVWEGYDRIPRTGNLEADYRNYLINEISKFTFYGIPLKDKLTVPIEEIADKILEESDEIELVMCNDFSEDPRFDFKFSPVEQQLYVATRKMNTESWNKMKGMFKEGEDVLLQMKRKYKILKTASQ